MMIAGGVTPSSSVARLAAEHFNQRVIDDLDDLLARRDRFEDGWPTAWSVTLSINDRTTGSATSASSKATRTSRIASRTSLSFERTAAAQAIKNAAQPLAQTIEHALTPASKSKQKTPTDENSSVSDHPLALKFTAFLEKRPRQ